MALNFDQQITDITRQINSYIKKGTIIPNKLLDYYGNLLGLKKLLTQEEGLVGDPPSLNFLSYVDFNTQLVLGSPNNISFATLQNNGSSEIYFSPIEHGFYSKDNSFVLSPGSSWSTDKRQFMSRGIWASPEIIIGSKLIIYYIENV